MLCKRRRTMYCVMRQVHAWQASPDQLYRRQECVVVYSVILYAAHNIQDGKPQAILPKSLCDRRIEQYDIRQVARQEYLQLMGERFRVVEIVRFRKELIHQTIIFWIVVPFGILSP